MSTVAITYTVPGGSPVDMTSSCVFEETTFTQQMNAVAGSFSVKVRDPNRMLSFETGWEISVAIDGVVVFAGYITRVTMGHFAPAANTANLSTYDLRTWTLEGVDYNIIFDRRVLRNTADYLHRIDLTLDTTDGAILRDLVDNYGDLSDFSSSGIADIASIPGGDVWEQGKTFREPFENLSFFGGAVWYIDPTKTFIYKPYDNVQKRWGFSDVPNKTPITASPAAYQGATYPFRSVEGTEDGSYIVNDALVWGGSPFAGTAGGTVFSRTTYAASIAAHHRWQQGETHFGERLYSIQAQVDARSNVIVNGPPGADATGALKGLKYPQWQFAFTWFADDVPLLSGVPDHIIPGDIVTIVMNVFNVTKLLPLRTLTTSFPDAFVNDGTHKVQFQGTFGLQLSDPFTLWRFLLAAQSKAASVNAAVQPVVTPTSTSTTYGAMFQGAPTPATDGVTTVFNTTFGYISGTTQVYRNGLLQRPGVDYTETNNVTGEITFSTAPLATDNLFVICTTLEG